MRRLYVEDGLERVVGNGRSSWNRQEPSGGSTGRSPLAPGRASKLPKLTDCTTTLQSSAFCGYYPLRQRRLHAAARRGRGPIPGRKTRGLISTAGPVAPFELPKQHQTYGAPCAACRILRTVRLSGQRPRRSDRSEHCEFAGAGSSSPLAGARPVTPNCSARCTRCRWQSPEANTTTSRTPVITGPSQRRNIILTLASARAARSIAWPLRPAVVLRVNWTASAWSALAGYPGQADANATRTSGAHLVRAARAPVCPMALAVVQTQVLQRMRPTRG